MQDSLTPLLVNYEYPTTTTNCGGGGRVTQLLNEGLNKAGHNPLLATDTEDGHYTTFPFRVHPQITAFIEKHDVDLLHGHFSVPSSLFLPYYARRYNLPLVISVMGADIYDPTRYHSIRPLLNQINNLVLSRADAVAAPSTDMQHRITSKHGLTARHIPYGIPAANVEWREHSRHSPFRLLSVCRQVERKNLDTAIRAVQRLRDVHGVDARYRLVGTGPLHDQLRRDWSDCGWVEFPGYVDDLGEEYKWGDVFVLPSEHEAFGMVFLEAIGHGLPVVTSNSGGQTDIVTGDIGACVPPTTERLAEAMQTIAHDYPAYQRATRGYIEGTYTTTEMTANYIAVYREVCG